jgi:micrococcal nuclease
MSPVVQSFLKQLTRSRRRLLPIFLVLMGVLVLAMGGATQPQSSQTYELVGKVVRVADGDTLTLRQATNERIRLASIDSPEKSSGSDRPGQPYAEAARKFLAEQVAGQSVKLLCFETDRYGRHICDVPIKDGGPLTTVNQSLVLAGMAWANQQAGGKYLRDKSLLLLQAQAKAAKRGIWAEPNPTPPWVWRYECWRNGKCNK